MKPIKKQGDTWKSKAWANDRKLAPGELPLCEGRPTDTNGQGGPHDLVVVKPVDRFDPDYKNGDMHECTQCKTRFCRHKAS